MWLTFACNFIIRGSVDTKSKGQEQELTQRWPWSSAACWLAPRLLSLLSYRVQDQSPRLV